MAATAGYQAGIETNQTQISYAVEATWGTRPLVQFQAIRYMSESLAISKTRQRPSEINVTREVSQAVTTEVTAGGSINYALSFGTFDDFFSSLCQGEWSPPFSIVSITTDITMTSVGSSALTLSSTLATKFTNINVGQIIRISGFTTMTGYNNYWKVTAKADNSHLTLFGYTVAAGSETSAGGNVLITGSTLNNGTTFKSLFVQQKFSPSMFLRYGGCYVTRATLQGSVGNFFTGTFDIAAQYENSFAAEASTGATLAAPSGTVIDPVAGWARILRNMTPGGFITGSYDQFSMTIENTGAAPEFALGALTSGFGGAAAANGMLGGTFTVSGAFRLYLNNFSMYDQFAGEIQTDLQIMLQDAALNSYVLTIQDALLMCRINVTGPGTAAMLDVTFEGNPDPTIGGTFQLDRHPPPH